MSTDLERLQRKSWWAATGSGIRRTIEILPDDCAGFVKHLADRPEVGGGVRILSLHRLYIPGFAERKIFGMYLVFTVVKTTDSSVTFTYQYHIWKQGPESGTKGLILLGTQTGTKGDIATFETSHLVCLKGFSFAVGSAVHDTPGGFGDVLSLEAAFMAELSSELGISAADLDGTVPLGHLLVDRGLTANRPRMVAALLDASASTKICAHPKNTDVFEMESGPVIVPVTELWGPDGFVMQNDDSFFLGNVARLVSLGLLVGPTG